MSRIRAVLAGALAVSALLLSGCAPAEHAAAPFLSSADYQQPSHDIQVLSTTKVSDRTFELKISSPLIDDGATSSGNGLRITLPVGYTTSRSYPVLYLLPGTSPDSSYADWTEHGQAESILGSSQLITVMPDDGRAGWYSNWADSSELQQHWESFHLDSLIPWVDSHLNTVPNRASRAVIGASAGGYGAIHYAEDRPELFSFAASLSGALDWRLPQLRTLIETETEALGEAPDPILSAESAATEAQWGAANPISKIGALKNTAVVLYAGSGTEGQDLGDPQHLEWLLAKSSQNFAELLTEQKNRQQKVQQLTSPLPNCDGGHNWGCWSSALHELLPKLQAAISPQHDNN